MKALFFTILFGIAAQAQATPVKIEFVYRDETTIDDSRLFQIQGERDTTSLTELCGASGAKCFCEFYSRTKRVIATDSVISTSVELNLASCEMSANTGIDPDEVMYARIRRAGNARKYSELEKVKTALSFNEALGNHLSVGNIRKIYRYGCDRTFIEGEGVVGSTNTVNCVANQALGFLKARYHYYLFDSISEGGNVRSEFGGDTPFSSTICGYHPGMKISCDRVSESNVRYGLYSQYAPPFVVEVALTAKPEGNIHMPTKGFAALTDSGGNCPVGLIKIRPFRAQPKSIGDQRVDPFSLPSNFLNSNNNLTATLVEDARLTIADFVVTRTANTGFPYPNGRCSMDGTTNPPYLCGQIRLQEPTVATTASYTAEAPVVCAIPQALLPIKVD